MPEVAILTSAGVKVPDVVWCSKEFLSNCWSDMVLLRAPEICVEVVSRSNSEKEMRDKVRRYLQAGSVEVWLVSEEGVVLVHTSGAVSELSTFGFNPTQALADR